MDFDKIWIANIQAIFENGFDIKVADKTSGSITAIFGSFMLNSIISEETGGTIQFMLTLNKPDKKIIDDLVISLKAKISTIDIKSETDMEMVASISKIRSGQRPIVEKSFNFFERYFNSQTLKPPLIDYWSLAVLRLTLLVTVITLFIGIGLFYYAQGTYEMEKARDRIEAERKANELNATLDDLISANLKSNISFVNFKNGDSIYVNHQQNFYIKTNIESIRNIHIVIHPTLTGQYWVQNSVSTLQNGIYRCLLYFGQSLEKNNGLRFETRIFVNTIDSLKVGQILSDWPESEYRSRVYTFIKKEPNRP